MIKRKTKLLLILLTMALLPAGFLSSDNNGGGYYNPLSSIQAPKSFKTNIERFRYYKKLYGKDCASEKITDNRGNGNESLYGTRNMRVILHGVAYRGGANNVYNKNNKRENNNPLQKDGLVNLCKNGFDAAVYLYGTNFKEAPKEIHTKENGNTLNYYQNSLGNEKDIRKMVKMVYDAINDPNAGPIYLHCWNGWHQSGYASTILLKQFCKVSDDEAVKYWEKNADGAGNKGYDHIKKKIRNFEPFKEYEIPDNIRKEICPCMK